MENGTYHTTFNAFLFNLRHNNEHISTKNTGQNLLPEMPAKGLWLTLIVLAFSAFTTTSLADEIETSFYDLNKNPQYESTVNDSVMLGDSIYFLGFDLALGSRLYRKNENLGFVELLTLSEIDDSAAHTKSLHVFNNELYILVNNGVGKLWKFSESCSCVSEIAANLDSIEQVAVHPNNLFLVATGRDVGSELWKLDTETNRAQLVGDFNTGHGNYGSSNIGSFFVVDERLYFSATNAYDIRKLWFYDTVTNRLKQVTNINEQLQQEQKYYAPHVLGAANGYLAVEMEYLGYATSRGGQLWLFKEDDATAVKVADLNHYYSWNNDGWMDWYNPVAVLFQDDSFFYVANEDQTGDHVWRYNINSAEKTKLTDGSIGSTILTGGESQPHITSLYHTNNKLFFYVRINNSHSYSDVWMYDFTREDLQRINIDRQWNYYDEMAFFYELGDFLFFLGEDRDLSVISLSNQEVTKVRAFNHETLSRASIIGHNNGLKVVATTPGHSMQLWNVDEDLLASRLSAIGTGNAPSNPTPRTVVNDHMYFIADAGEGEGLWRMSENGHYQQMTLDFPDYVRGFGIHMVKDNDIFLSARRNQSAYNEIWKYNTLDNTLSPVREINSNSLRNIVVSAHENQFILFYATNESGVYQLWKYDTEQGTTNVIANVIDYAPVKPVINKGEAFFHRYINNYFTPWKYDLTSEQLTQLSDDTSRECASQSFQIEEFEDSVYFTQYGRLLKYNRLSNQTESLDCVESIDSFNGDVLLRIKSEDNRRVKLWRINNATGERSLVSQLHVEEDYVKVGNEIHAFAYDEQWNKGIWSINLATGIETKLNDLSQSDNIRFHWELIAANEKTFFVSFDTNYDLYLWETGKEQPIIDFKERGVQWIPSQLFSFAGDLWGEARLSEHGIYYPGELLRIHLSSEYAPGATKLDFDGDGKADVAFRLPQSSVWSIESSASQTFADTVFGLQQTDIPVAGDYDGDGTVDIAVRRPTSKWWYVINSSKTNLNSDRGDGIQRTQLGLADEDIPVPADYDGDNITDLAVRRPSKGLWIIRQSGNGEIVEVNFGQEQSDIPVVGDFDGDGTDDVAFRRVSNKTWYIRNSSGSNYNSERQDGIQRITLGLADDDVPIPADYDGDGITDIAVWRASTQAYIIKLSSTGAVIERWFDHVTDGLPVAADYDGDGIIDTSAFSQSTGQWFFRLSSTDLMHVREFTMPLGAIPVGMPVSITTGLLSSNISH